MNITYQSNIPGNAKAAVIPIQILKKHIRNQFTLRGLNPKTVDIITTSEYTYIWCRNNNQLNSLNFDLIKIKRKI